MKITDLYNICGSIENFMSYIHSMHNSNFIQEDIDFTNAVEIHNYREYSKQKENCIRRRKNNKQSIFYFKDDIDVLYFLVYTSRKCNLYTAVIDHWDKMILFDVDKFRYSNRYKTYTDMHKYNDFLLDTKFKFQSIEDKYSIIL